MDATLLHIKPTGVYWSGCCNWEVYTHPLPHTHADAQTGSIFVWSPPCSNNARFTSDWGNLHFVFQTHQCDPITNPRHTALIWLPPLLYDPWACLIPASSDAAILTDTALKTCTRAWIFGLSLRPDLRRIIPELLTKITRCKLSTSCLQWREKGGAGRGQGRAIIGALLENVTTTDGAGCRSSSPVGLIFTGRCKLRACYGLFN